MFPFAVSSARATRRRWSDWEWTRTRPSNCRRIRCTGGRIDELAAVCTALHLPLADTTEDLVQAERDGDAQYWEYDTHPRPAGYATIARRIDQVLRSPAQ